MNKRLLSFYVVILTSVLSFAKTKIELGEQAMDSANYEAAVNYFTDHLKAEPKSCKAYMRRSLAFGYLGDYVASISDASMAIKLWNKKVGVPISVPYLMRANVYATIEDYNKAFEDLNTAIKKDKKNALCYFRRGQLFYKLETYDKAEADYRKAYAIDKANTEYALAVARCLLQQKKAEEAATILDNIIRYEPLNAEAKRLRALMYSDAGEDKPFVDLYISYLSLADNGDLDMLLYTATKEYAYVLKAVNEKLKTAESDATRFYWLGVRARVYQTKEQYTEALADLRAMKALLPDTATNTFIMYQTAECHIALYEYAEAAELYSKLIELSSDDAYTSVFRYRRAQCYADLGKHQQAISDYSAIIENDVDAAPSAYYGRGIIKEVLKDFDGALEDYNKGLLLDKNNRGLHMMRGRLYLLQKKDTIRANTDFNKILEIDTIPENSCRQYALMYMGKFDEAIEWNKKKLEAEPNAGSYYDAACLYARMNKKKEAIKYFKESLELGYRNFVHIEEDTDLDAIRDMQEFKDLIVKYRKEKIKNLFNKLQ